MGDLNVDAAIVGASLAGCTAATLLAREGLRVALVDKHAGPDAYKPLCGHFIQASATPVLERLGVTRAIESAGGVRNGIEIWASSGWIVPPPGHRDRHHGYSIRRLKLDPIVRTLALSSGAVEYLPGRRAVELLREPGGRVAGVEACDRAGRALRIRAPLVIGADGRTSTVAQLAGARERRAANERFCAMAYYEGVGLPPGCRGRLWRLEPDAAIAAPNDDELTLMAAFLHKRRLPEFRADRAGALEALFGSLPDGPRMAGARRAGKVMGFADYPLIARDATPLPGVALTGDAALTSDPLPAIGCGWALESAAWLSDAAAPALAGAEPLDTALRRYARRRRRGLAGHHRLIAAEARARGANPVQRLLFTAAARDPRVAEHVMRFGERRGTPRELLSPGVLARSVRVALGGRDRPARLSPA